jgi:hypothetical protein
MANGVAIVPLLTISTAIAPSRSLHGQHLYNVALEIFSVCQMVTMGMFLSAWSALPVWTRGSFAKWEPPSPGEPEVGK